MPGSRWVVLAIALVAAGLLGLGSAALARTRQVGREQELVVAWKTLGGSLRQAAGEVGVDVSDAPDSWELSRAPEDPEIRRRVDSVEAKVWKALARRKGDRALDPVREELRRERERVGLALAHCREGVRSIPSRWFLVGFPRR